MFVKYEGLNPTGSFKDRGMTVALSKALEGGARSVICASTGNTSAAAAAYAARAGMGCYVLLPAGKIAMGKLTQAVVHGARTVTVDGNFDDALRLVREPHRQPGELEAGRGCDAGFRRRGGHRQRRGNSPCSTLVGGERGDFR